MTDAEKLAAIRALLTDRKWVPIDQVLNILNESKGQARE